MEKEGQYLVVDFAGEDSVEAVPKMWVDFDENKMIGFCYWPCFNQSKLARKCQLPDKTKWKKCVVRVFADSFTDDYDQALAFAKTAEETNNVNGDDLYHSISRARRRPPSLYDSENDDSGPSKKLKRHSFPVLSIAEKEENADSLKSIIPLPTPSSLQRIDSGKCVDFEGSVLKKLDTIIENQNESMALLRTLMASSKGNWFEEQFLYAPLTTVAELEDFSNKLTDDDFRLKTIMHLSSLGGRSLGQRVRNILKHLGTNELWSLYSLKGKKQKKALQPLAICKAIIQSCMRTDVNTTVAEVENVIGETLKYAPKKCGK